LQVEKLRLVKQYDHYRSNVQLLFKENKLIDLKMISFKFNPDVKAYESIL